MASPGANRQANGFDPAPPSALAWLVAVATLPVWLLWGAYRGARAYRRWPSWLKGAAVVAGGLMVLTVANGGSVWMFLALLALPLVGVVGVVLPVRGVGFLWWNVTALVAPRRIGVAAPPQRGGAMAQSYLPAGMQTMVALLHEAATSGDREAWRLVVERGNEALAATFAPHPAKRPWEYFQRYRAQLEWQALVRQTQGEMGAAVLSTTLEEFTYTIRHNLEERKFQDAETRRVRALQNDTEATIKQSQASEVARGAAEAFIIQAQADAEIRVAQAKADIALAMGVTDKDPVAIVNMVNAKIDAIEADPNFSEDRKHRMAQLWRDALPKLIEAATLRHQP